MPFRFYTGLRAEQTHFQISFRPGCLERNAKHTLARAAWGAAPRIRVGKLKLACLPNPLIANTRGSGINLPRGFPPCLSLERAFSAVPPVPPLIGRFLDFKSLFFDRDDSFNRGLPANRSFQINQALQSLDGTTLW